MWEIKGYLYSPGAPHPLQLLRGAGERGHRMTLRPLTILKVRWSKIEQWRPAKRVATARF